MHTNEIFGRARPFMHGSGSIPPRKTHRPASPVNKFIRRRRHRRQWQPRCSAGNRGRAIVVPWLRRSFAMQSKGPDVADEGPVGIHDELYCKTPGTARLPRPRWLFSGACTVFQPSVLTRCPHERRSGCAWYGNARQQDHHNARPVRHFRLCSPIRGNIMEKHTLKRRAMEWRHNRTPEHPSGQPPASCSPRQRNATPSASLE